MKAQHQSQETTGTSINVFCARGNDAWRVHANATALPNPLQPFFDRNGELYPVLFLDFDDLAEFMAAHDATYDMRVSRLGSVELRAQGDSAIALSTWLATAFSSGVRPAIRR